MNKIDNELISEISKQAYRKAYEDIRREDGNMIIATFIIAIICLITCLGLLIKSQLGL
tara:strand:- start:452 stop:625 length:174 start_codon:yes stop_codon:yes gene_type:complete